MTKLTKSLSILYQASTYPKFFIKFKVCWNIEFAVYWELCSERFCRVVPRLGRDAVKLLHKNKEGFCYLTGLFLITKSLNIDISSKNKLCSAVDVFSLVRVILFFWEKEVRRGDKRGLKLLNYSILTFCVRGMFKSFQTSEMELFAESF